MRYEVTRLQHVVEEEDIPCKAQRGLITVIDRKGLEAFSDPSYGVPEAEYARLVLKGAPATSGGAGGISAPENQR